MITLIRNFTILLVVAAYLLFGAASGATANASHPRALIVFDSQGQTNVDNPLREFHLDLACAISAHVNAYQDVTVLYQRNSENVVNECNRILQVKAGRGNVEYEQFDEPHQAMERIQEYMSHRFVPTAGVRPTPFCFFIVLGHGELRKGMQCLRSANDVISLGSLEQSWNRSLWPVICIYHLCRPELDGEVNTVSSVAGPDPLVTDKPELIEFVNAGRGRGVRLGQFGGAKSVVRIASTSEGSNADNDHTFMAAYEQAFITTRTGRVEVFELMRKEQPGKTLWAQSRSILPWEKVLKFMTDVNVSQPDMEVKNAAGVTTRRRRRKWDLSTAAMASHGITGSHFIASTNPNFPLQSPALELTESFQPAVDPPVGRILSFQVLRNENVTRVIGVSATPNLAYGALNVAGMFKPAGDKSVSTFGKTLYFECQSARPMMLMVNNNATGAVWTLSDVVRVGPIPIVVRIPSRGYFGTDVADTGISLAPWSGWTRSQVNTGWLGNTVDLGRMLLIDAGPNEKDAIDTWNEWHGVKERVSLNQRWIPQFWWYDTPGATLSLSNSGVAPTLVAEGGGRVAIGGPLLFLKDLHQGKNKFKLSCQLEKVCQTPKPAKISLLLFKEEQLVYMKDLERFDGRHVGEFEQSLTPDYFAVVIHGGGGIVIKDVVIGNPKSRR
jgi:hypothetical protein